MSIGLTIFVSQTSPGRPSCPHCGAPADAVAIPGAAPVLTCAPCRAQLPRRWSTASAVRRLLGR